MDFTLLRPPKYKAYIPAARLKRVTPTSHKAAWKAYRIPSYEP